MMIVSDTITLDELKHRATVAKEHHPRDPGRGDARQDHRDRGAKDHPVSAQHHDLAAGRWRELSFVEQMANIGSEVERTLNWRARANVDYSRNAFMRALELVDLTMAAAATAPRRRELARVREAMVDFFDGANDYGSTTQNWRSYFQAFNYAARRHH
jgi:hypothetical protein